MILPTISAVIFFSYIAFILVRYGVQPSVSESYYCLPEKYKFVFTLVMWGFTLPLMFAANSLLMMLAGTGIFFVGAAVAFKQPMTRTVHYVAAALGIGFGMVWIISVGLWWLPLMYVLCSASFWFVLDEEKIWWIEILSFTLIILAFILK
jgi:ABC-type iron transport system FetAB permease component